MTTYQVPLSLCGAAIISGVTLFLTHRSRQPDLRLPITQDASFADDVHSDVFLDVIKAGELQDGNLTDETFWGQMKKRKLLLAVLSVAIITLEGILGFYKDGRSTLAEYVLRTAFAFYVGILVLHSVNQPTDRHSESVIHITALTFCSSALYFVAEIFSSTVPPLSAYNISAFLPLSAYNLSTFLPFLTSRYSTITLYTLAFAIAATTPRGPPMHFNPLLIYSVQTTENTTNQTRENTSRLPHASVLGYLFYNYVSPVIPLGNSNPDIGDFPILPANIRASYHFNKMRRSFYCAKPHTGQDLARRLISIHKLEIGAQTILALVAAPVWFAFPFFVRRLIAYLQGDPDRLDKGWGCIYALGQVASLLMVSQLNSQIWFLVSSVTKGRLRLQLNTMLYAKTLVRKDVIASGASSSQDQNDGEMKNENPQADIFNLLTIDVDKVSGSPEYMYYITDSPIVLALGTYMLYQMIGISCIVGLATLILFLLFNSMTTKMTSNIKNNAKKATDERTSVTNEALNDINKFKTLQNRVMEIRERELKFIQQLFRIDVIFSCIWEVAPLVSFLVSYAHFSMCRQQALTPSIAFTSMLVFNKMHLALGRLPQTIWGAIDVHVSLNRIGKYLQLPDVDHVPSTLPSRSLGINFKSDIITWRSDHSADSSATSSPQGKFKLVDLDLKFPQGISLVCGTKGSGKTLLLLALLGEADVIGGQNTCPRSQLNMVASYVDDTDEWELVRDACAYVPQVAWLRNASVKDNILFGLPFNRQRYNATIEACQLNDDVNNLPREHDTEIGKYGINLSDGQKARIGLARAVYSCASILLLDDILSAVDASMAKCIHQCIKGPLMHGRTVILVSDKDNASLLAPDASYFVVLDNGRLKVAGSSHEFEAYLRSTSTDLSGGAANNSKTSDHAERSLVTAPVPKNKGPGPMSETSFTMDDELDEISDDVLVALMQDGTDAGVPETSMDNHPEISRKLVQDEKFGVGSVGYDVWQHYVKLYGGRGYWAWFSSILVLGALWPVVETGWLKTWSGSDAEAKGSAYYIGIYVAITLAGVLISISRYFLLNMGSIRASTIFHQRLLEAVLLASIKFRGNVQPRSLLKRFGKDLAAIDSKLPLLFGKIIMFSLTVVVSVVSVVLTSGIPFLLPMVFLGVMYIYVAKKYAFAVKDLQRLESTSYSSLNAIYDETISGSHVIRAFGASSKFLRDMLCCVDMYENPNYWQVIVARWLAVRCDVLSAMTIGVTSLISVSNPAISAALAGFTLLFAARIMENLQSAVRRSVMLERTMMSVKRVKQYSEVEGEAFEDAT